MRKLSTSLFLLALIVSYSGVNAQDDLLNLLDSVSPKPQSEKVTAAFKAIKVINAHSLETVKKGVLDFRITHRFGNAGVKSNGGSHTLWGFDNASNIRFSFDYGVTDRLMVGFGRSKVMENLDGSYKFKLLEQTSDNKVPISIVIYSDMIYSPMKDTAMFKKRLHRFSYTHQAIIGSKLGDRLSLEVLPTFVHRNYIIEKDVNPYNGEKETNDIFALGFAGRIKLNKRHSIVFDYFYPFSEYRKGNTLTPFYHPASIGMEIETGGHVFHLNFSNSSGIIERDFITNTTDSWWKGGFKFGFNISRVFTIQKK